MNIKKQSDRQNTPLTDDEINRAIEEAENARDSFQYIWLLDGIVLQDEIEIFPGIRLVPFPRSLGKRGEKIPRYVSKWASTVGIDYFFHKTQLTIDPSEAPEFNSEQFCEALSLTCNFAVQIATVISVKKDEEPFSLVPYAGPLVTYLPRDASKDSDIVEAKCLNEHLEKLDSDVRRKLRIPINRWIKSHTEQSAMFNQMIDPEIRPEDIPGSLTTREVDKMIDLGIAFESLYLSGRKNLSRKFRRRASWFLKKDEAHRKALKEKFEKVYDLRCDAVHEGKLPRDVEVCGKSVPISEFIKQAQNLCQQSILKIIKDTQFPDWAKIHIPDC
ncbi:MAG: HEPN domain-containing protein [Candidatus Poribacteria bacterium]|nr:HEPN domain-containing protein [Candidatus Poribacteria bacterium]